MLDEERVYIESYDEEFNPSGCRRLIIITIIIWVVIFCILNLIF